MNWYIKIDKIEGDVEVKSFEKCIKVLGVNGPGIYNTTSENNTATHASTFSLLDIQLFLPIGKHVSQILTFLKTNNAVWNKVVLTKVHHANQADGSSTQYETAYKTIEMQSVRVSTLCLLFRPSTTEDQDSVDDITMMLALNYETIQIQHRPRSKGHVSKGVGTIAISKGVAAIKVKT